jgi:hypothetical protein
MSEISQYHLFSGQEVQKIQKNAIKKSNKNAIKMQ